MINAVAKVCWVRVNQDRATSIVLWETCGRPSRASQLQPSIANWSWPQQ